MIEKIEIIDRQVSQADDGKFYGRWTTEITDSEGYRSTADHFTAGFGQAAEAEAAIPAQ